MNRAQTVRAINDVLQKRSDRTIESLLDEVKKKLGESGADVSAEIASDVKDFIHQQSTLNSPYTKSSSKDYKYKIFDPGAKRPLKIVNQQIYDWAAKAGFPPNFFRETYFDRVTFYCIPDHTDFNFSNFSNCTFAVCRIREATFDGTSFSSSEFHSCAMQYVTFFMSSITHTHFYDCTLRNTSFLKARLKSCNTLDSKLESVGFLEATLDNCFFGRVAARGIRNLHTATITQGGATDEEVTHNREAIYAALRPESKESQPMPHKAREAR